LAIIGREWLTTADESDRRDLKTLMTTCGWRSRVLFGAKFV